MPTRPRNNDWALDKLIDDAWKDGSFVSDDDESAEVSRVRRARDDYQVRMGRELAELGGEAEAGGAGRNSGGHCRERIPRRPALQRMRSRERGEQRSAAVTRGNSS